MTELVTTNRGYQKPRPGQKLKDDVLRLIAALDAIDVDVAELLVALADKSNVGHGHGMDAITGLAAALGNKLDVGHHDALGDLTDVDIAGAANGMALLRQAAKWIPVALQINNIAGLETALNGKATPADIAALKSELLNGAGPAFDTLMEFAAALGNDPNFSASVGNALGFRVRADAAQAFNAAQQGQARANVGGHVLDGYRNKLMNGLFAINYRTPGAGTIPPLNSAWICDRWRVYNGTNQTLSWQIVYTVGTSGEAPGYITSFLNIGFGAVPTNGGNVSIFQYIEGVSTLAGEDVTVTGYYSFGQPADVQHFAIQQFGVGGAAELAKSGARTPIAPGLFKRHSATVKLASINGKGIGGDNRLNASFAFWPAHAANYAFTGMSLVRGDATQDADPFAPRPWPVETAMVQRYFEAGHWICYASAASAGQPLSTQQHYKATKRGGATVGITLTSSANISGTGVDYGQSGTVNVVVSATNAGPVQAYGAWTADSEIY